MMYCMAIGDMMLTKNMFDAILAESKLFKKYVSVGWKENYQRAKARNAVRVIETKGHLAYEPTQEILDMVSDVEVLFIHLFPVSKTLLDAAKNLKYILTARGGVENINVDYATEKGIKIINCPEHNAIAVAEFTIGVIINEMRNISRSHIALNQKEWREVYPNSKAIPELVDSTVGLIGYGTIGKLVAERLKVFGSRILISDPYVDADEIAKDGFEKMEIDDLLKKSDVVSLHGRIGNSDPPIIGHRELGLMKPSAYLINTARANVLDMDALEEALRERYIMGAALDVFPVEPLPEDFPLLNFQNVTLTNHRGGDTLNSYVKAPEILLNRLISLTANG